MYKWELFKENKIFSFCHSMSRSHFGEQLKDVAICFAFVVKFKRLTPRPILPQKVSNYVYFRVQSKGMKFNARLPWLHQQIYVKNWRDCSWNYITSTIN